MTVSGDFAEYQPYGTKHLTAETICHCPWHYEFENPERYCDFCPECVSIHGPRQARKVTLDKPVAPQFFCRMYEIELRWLEQRNPRAWFLVDPWIMERGVPWTVPIVYPPLDVTAGRSYNLGSPPQCDTCPHFMHGTIPCPGYLPGSFESCPCGAVPSR